jgi:regulator of sirC expression with transglutaminase-like and TPR domain
MSHFSSATMAATDLMKNFLLLLLLLAHPLLGLAQAKPDAALQQADALDAALQNRQALELLLPLEKEQPKNTEVLLRIARQYCLLMTDTPLPAEKQRLGGKALEYAQRSVALEPRNPKALLAVAVAYGRLAKQADNRTKLTYSKLVKESAERSLAIAPDDDTTHYVLGAWNLEIASLGTMARTMARVVYGSVPTASLADAEQHLKRAVQLNPKRLATHVELGRVYAQQGRKDDARRELQAALAMPLREKDDANAKRRATKTLGDL